MAIATLVTTSGFEWRNAFWIGASIAVIGSLAIARLRETPGYYGLWIIMLPIAIGFAFGVNHFEKLEQQSDDRTKGLESIVALNSSIKLPTMLCKRLYTQREASWRE
ncbi:MAG: hypothetical protein NT128_01590 [Proteobacteria bacterium]|nr:hypothetical protein [Pseudomonadota bacterium]